MEKWGEIVMFAKERICYAMYALKMFKKKEKNIICSGQNDF